MVHKHAYTARFKDTHINTRMQSFKLCCEAAPCGNSTVATVELPFEALLRTSTDGNKTCCVLGEHAAGEAGVEEVGELIEDEASPPFPPASVMR